MMDISAPLLTDRPDLAGKVVLVTGGTGSFGRAFVSWALTQPELRKIIVLSRDEQKHYAMQTNPAFKDDPRVRYFVGDVRDRNRLMRAFKGVDIVIHAAAMKHVHIAEYNPMEAIRTNIDGAANVIDAAIDRGVERVIALSTDKAASPINLYGATKLCMEKLIIAANSYAGEGGTRFDLVRYGNVVGSMGSVVPLFQRQLAEGQLTLTEPTMTRFWIGMDRTVDLVLLALKEGRGGEIFIPKLPACTVATLASALAPGVEQRIIGIRPGEKVHESLTTIDEARKLVEYEAYYVVEPEFPSWSRAPRNSAGKVVDGFTYSSDITYQLDVAETRELLTRLGFVEA